MFLMGLSRVALPAGRHVYAKWELQILSFNLIMVILAIKDKS